MKKTFKVILNILIWLLIIFLFAYCVFLYYFKTNEIVFFNKIKNNTITKEIDTEFETIEDMPNYAFFDMIYFGKNTNDKYTIVIIGSIIIIICIPIIILHTNVNKVFFLLLVLKP